MQAVNEVHRPNPRPPSPRTTPRRPRTDEALGDRRKRVLSRRAALSHAHEGLGEGPRLVGSAVAEGVQGTPEHPRRDVRVQHRRCALAVRRREEEISLVLKQARHRYKKTNLYGRFCLLFFYRELSYDLLVFGVVFAAVGRTDVSRGCAYCWVEQAGRVSTVDLWGPARGVALRFGGSGWSLGSFSIAPAEALRR